MLSLYISEEKLSEICMEGGLWYDIIKNNNTYLSLHTMSGNNTWDVSNKFLKDLHRSKKLIPDDELYEDICKDESVVRELPNPIYILNFDKNKADKISQKYGVIVLPSDNLEEPKISKQGWYIETIEKEKRSWSYILSDIGVPFHSLLIVDRYLFSNESGETFEDSLFNLRSILTVLLPQNEVKDLTVTIVFDADSASVDFKTICNRLNKIKKNLRTYHFNVELMSITGNDYGYEDTHDRFIISNYFVVDAAHKIKAFKENDGICCDQKISFSYLFSYGIKKEDRSSAPIVTQNRVINALCKSLEHILKPDNKNSFDYAFNGQVIKKENITIKNDLFDELM